jgi:hypothetical protein
MIRDLGWQYPKETSGQKEHLAIYECPFCGERFRSRVRAVDGGHTKSCGCIQKERVRDAVLKHGLYKTRLYRIYNNMKARCYRKSHPNYYRYGGRGITMCDEWKNDFMSFYNWSMANGYADDLTVDREDNDGGYGPDNCRWVSRLVNGQNKGKKGCNTSGYKGVLKYNENTWFARICNNFQYIHIGTFRTKEEAALAYNDWVIEHNTAHALNKVA